MISTFVDTKNKYIHLQRIKIYVQTTVLFNEQLTSLIEFLTKTAERSVFGVVNCLSASDLPACLSADRTAVSALLQQL